MSTSGNEYEYGDGHINKTWEVSCFEAEGFLRIPYLSTKKGATFTHGINILESVSKVYQGYWESKDSLSKDTIHEAYFLTDNLNSNEKDVANLIISVLWSYVI